MASRRDAEKALAEVVSKVNHNHYIDGSKLTVREFLVNEWLPAMSMSIEPSTWNGYKEYVHRYVLQRIGDIALRDLKPTKLSCCTPTCATTAAARSRRSRGRPRDR